MTKADSKRIVQPQVPAPLVDAAAWRPMASAPKNATLLLLLIGADDDREHPLEDSAEPTRTVGFNNFDNDGEDQWLFAGWTWEHDEFVQGRGTPVGWMPFPAINAPAPPHDEVVADLLAALKAIIALDDGDSPDLWHFQKEFDAGRAAIAKAEGIAANNSGPSSERPEGTPNSEPTP